MKISKLNQQLFASYRDMRLRALREEPDAFTSSYQQEARKGDAAWRQRLDSQDMAIFCAVEADRVIATSGCQFEEKEKKRHAATLIAIYVVPEWRGRGIARQLCETALEHAFARTEIQIVNLTVTGGNLAAGRLYESLGFHTWGEEPAALYLEGIYYSKVHMQLTRERREQQSKQ